jgi:hypothetical protein
MVVSSRPLLLLAAVAAAALPLSLGSEAGAATERVRVSAVGDGIVIRVLPGSASAVDFTLAGRRLARRHRAPYAVFVRGYRRAARNARRGLWVVARDARSGRRLARVRLTARRTTGAPRVSLTAQPDRVTNTTEARFAFRSVNARSTWCRLDAAAERRCTSPLSYRGLASGPHVFTVRAAGTRGRAATVSYGWTVAESTVLEPPFPLPPPAPPSGRTAAPPAPPGAYAIPPGAVTVTSSADLERALAVEQAADIVLADGVYDNVEPFTNAHGHRVYASRLGGSVLRAGFVVGHNWGVGNGLLRGLVFDVNDPAKTLHGDIVHVWGTAKSTRLLDLTLDGHKVLRSGIMVRQVEGAVVQRVVARNFRNWGVIVDANIRDLQVATPPLVEDIVATDVTWPEPQSSGGHSEACVWIGNTAVVRRILAVRCAWEGLWSGTASRGSVIEDVRADEAGVGVYLEHFNSGRTTFRRLDIGPNITTGLNCEWADPAWGSVPGCIDVVVEDSVFDTRRIGVYLDEGTTRTIVRRSVFRNQSWAAIGDHKGIDNSYSDNEVSGLRSGALPLSRKHIRSPSP